jgi:hypothetical protein
MGRRSFKVWHRFSDSLYGRREQPPYRLVYFDSGLGVFYNVEGQWVLEKFAGNYQPDTELLCDAMEQ